MKVTVLTGGVGGAKLVLGLMRSARVSALTAVVNTGDDFRHLGLAVSPDIDTLLYTLAGKANAGIDASNLGPDLGESEDRVLLLPEDPDRSAADIAAAILARLGLDLGVVISDSFGRPWRHGVVNVAIGCAGLPALVDRRGQSDRDGRPMQVTQVALADLIASAAGLAMGEADEGVPAALVSGYRLPGSSRPAADLIRPEAEDLFR